MSNNKIASCIWAFIMKSSKEALKRVMRHSPKKRYWDTTFARSRLAILCDSNIKA